MRRSESFAAAAAVFLSLTLETTEALAGEAGSAPAVCQSLWVTAADAPPKSVSRSRRPLDFSAAEVLDLEFLVMLPADGTWSGRKVELRVYTPKGHLYQTLAVPVGRSSSDKARSSKRRARYQTVRARLPVAGTTIVNNSLYGTWKAEAFLEGERSPCAKARSFNIKP